MDLTKLSAFEMKEKLHKKEITSRELIEAHFKMIEDRDDGLNAFITLNKEEALKAADRVDEKIKNGERLGLLAGLPIGLKDNIITKDLRTTCGSKMLENFIPPYNASVVDRIVEADGIIIGKTNMDEFAMGSSTETSYFGPSKNPLDLERVPGGSSGGSAAAVAAGQVALSLGTDTGGSVRQPASFTGIVGIKPSYGIVSRYGVVPMANTLDQVGVFGRDVSDAVLMMASITGYDEKDSTSFNNPEGTIIFSSFGGDIDEDYLKGMKIGVPVEYLKDLDQKIREKMDENIEILRKLGAEVEEISLPSLEYSLATYQAISSAEISSNMARFDGLRYGYRAEEYEDLDELFTRSRSQGLGDEVKRRIMIGTHLLSSGGQKEIYERALKTRTLIIQDFHRAFEKYDLILSPTTSEVAFKFGEKSQDPVAMHRSGSLSVGVNLAGLCAISVPAGNVEGLPIGMQFIGDKYKEANIIKAGLGLEGGRKIGL